MKVKILPFLLLLSIVFIASCTSKQEAISKAYVVTEQQPNVFVVDHEDPLAWVQDSKDKRAELNLMRAARDREDEEEEFEIKSRLRNVKRNIDGEFIVGFDEELDNPDFKEVE
jgi:phosphopantetheine adenylyltransferase